MSSPDFPGPSWQDKPEFAGDADWYRDGSGGYGSGASRGPAGANGGPGSGRHGEARGSGQGYGNGQGYRSGQGYGNGALPGDGLSRGQGGGRGSHDGGGYAGGRGAPPGGRSNGQGGGRYEEREYAAGSGAGRGREEYPRGEYPRPGGHRGARASDGGTDLLRNEPAYVRAPDYVGDRNSRGPRYGEGSRRRFGGRGPGGRGPGGPGNPYGPGGPGGPDGPDGPGGPPQVGRRLRAHGYAGRRPPAPGSILQRLWRGSWWRRWTLKKAALVTGGLAIGVVLILIAGFFYFYSSTPVPSAVLNQTLQQSSKVLFSNGKEVGCFCSVNRTNLSEAQARKSMMLVNAVTAAEDRNFFHEGGVSLTGIIRAAKNNILGGGNLQGGSTITEELVKQYYDHSYLGNLTYSQKLDEVIVSIKLAQQRSKWWVMTNYLNTIYFGAGAWGAEAAAETYFGKNAWQLDAGQAAMLAAMIQSPSGFDPKHPDKVAPGIGSLYWRWKNEVLANMVKDGNISQSAASALKFPTVTIRPPDTTWPGYRGYIMALVQDELSAYYHISPSQIGSMGLQIHTTINERLMNALYHTIAQQKAQMRALGSPLPWYVSIGAVLEKPGKGSIVAFYGGPNYELPKKRCDRVHCQNPTILDAAPVGSSFKPYVLTTAISQGMNAKTSITNSHSPLCIPPADINETYRLQLSKQTMKCDTGIGYYQLVQPSENTPGRNLTVPYATAESNNASFMDLIHRTGVNNVINMAQTLGVYSSTIDGLKNLFWSCQCKARGQFPGAVNAALGQGSLTPVDQANTFATLVSGGISATPHVIDYITQSGTKLPPKVVISRPLHNYVAADADFALSFDTNPAYGGTGVPNAVWNRPMIGKTGTLGQAYHSSAAWFIGAIPQYALSVGMFTDHPSSQYLDGLPAIGGWTGGYGGAWPATIWHAFMSQQFSNLPVKQLPTPNFNPPFFSKWVQAPPIVKCQPQGPGKFGGGGPPGKGGGPGRGHNHAVVTHFSLAKKGSKCQNTSPGPSPSPTGVPSPSPSASLSPGPSPSLSPSPSPPVQTTSSGAVTSAAAGSGRAPSRSPAPATGMPSLTTAAVLAGPMLRKPMWTVLTTGLV